MVKNSCIFYLVNNNPIHLNRLYNSLQCLTRNFLDRYPYPVVFGHEGLDQNTINKIKSYAPSNHFFHKIEFKLPDYSQEILNQIPEKFKGHWDDNAFFSMGYRHMCRYFSGEILKDTFFENVHYLLRIDCDSYFIDRVEEDIFDTMLQNNFKYASVGVEDDMDYVVEGLCDFCEKIAPINKNIPKNKMFQTHFELVNFKWFKEDTYLNFYNQIDKTGNIFIKRWGDAPIKYQAVNRLIPEESIHIFNLPYKHGGDL